MLTPHCSQLPDIVKNPSFVVCRQDTALLSPCEPRHSQLVAEHTAQVHPQRLSIFHCVERALVGWHLAAHPAQGHSKHIFNIKGSGQ